MQPFEGPYDAYVGFDVGKLAHRACCVLAGGAVAFNVGVTNDEAAIDRVLAEASARGRCVPSSRFEPAASLFSEPLRHDS